MTMSRFDPAWYTPADLPAELLALGGAVPGGLDVGAPGKVGLLEVSLAPIAGTSRVVRQYQRAPLHLYRPIYLDPSRPDMAFLFLQQAGDGLIQGDRYRIDIDCSAGSAVHVTTQAATNVYPAQRNFATQLVNLRAGAGAIMEYLPDPVVPFRGSRLFQRTCLVADPDSIAILGETLLPGRAAHGEVHIYDRYWTETEVRRPDGTLLFADVLRLNPADEDPRSIARLGSHDVLATLYVLATGSDSLVASLRSALAACPDVLAGVSTLPNHCGAVVRLLGPTSKSVRVAVHVAWSAVRLALFGTPAPNRRKGETGPGHNRPRQGAG